MFESKAISVPSKQCGTMMIVLMRQVLLSLLVVWCHCTVMISHVVHCGQSLISQIKNLLFCYSYCFHILLSPCLPQVMAMSVCLFILFIHSYLFEMCTDRAMAWPPYLQLATSEMWCWSGGRGVLIQLSLCCSIVFYYNGAQRYEQFFQVGWLYRALILLGLALCLPSASVSLVLMVLYRY